MIGNGGVDCRCGLESGEGEKMFFMGPLYSFVWGLNDFGI